MMKKQLFSLVIMLLVSTSVFAIEAEINGLWYELVSKVKEASVIASKNSSKYTGDVVIPEKVEYGGETYRVTSIKNSAFFNCRDLISITIPNSLTNIGYDAFGYCTRLTSVHISDIEAWCNIAIDSNPLSYAHHLFLDGEEIRDLVVPNSVTNIGKNVFMHCSGITSVTIPESVTSIGDYAFFYCDGLVSVTIEGSSMLGIGDYAFQGCDNLAFVTLSDGLKNIGDGAFSGCTSLNSLKIPNGVTSIGGDAFGRCKNMTTVDMPNSVKIVGYEAFSGCSGLTTISIGNGVETIYQEAFANCSELIDFYCYAIEVPSMKYRNNKPCTNAFKDSYIEYATLHVPAASLDMYKASEPWNSFGTILPIGDTPVSPQCGTPTIKYANGKLSFESETEGVKFVCEVTDSDVKKYNSAEINLSVTYNVTVYATKAGYDNSGVATATLCWIDASPDGEGFINGVAQMEARPVILQTRGNIIDITGVKDGEEIKVYGVGGQLAGSAKAYSESVCVSTTLNSGSVAIVKIGEKSIKIVMK